MSTRYSPKIVTDGLILCLDAGSYKSYETGTYLISEDFEAGTQPSSFYEYNGYENLVTWGNSTSPISGSKSLSWTNNNLFISARLPETQSDLNLFFGMVQPNTVTNGGGRVEFLAENGELLTQLDINTNLGLALSSVSNGSYSASSATGIVTNNMVNFYWLSYSAGTGNNASYDVYVSSTPAKPSAAAASYSTSPVTKGAKTIRWYNSYWDDSAVKKIDTVRASNKKLGSYGKIAQWNDLSGNKKNGTLINEPTYNAGNKGNLYFNGSNSYVDFGYQLQTLFKSNWSDPTTYYWSVSAWVKYSGMDYTNILQGVTGFDGLILGLVAINNGPMAKAVWYPSSGQSLPSSSVLRPNVWYNIVWINSRINEYGSNAKIYINGNLEVNYDGAVVFDGLTTISVQVGKADLYSTPRYLNGNVASLQFYKKALSATEIKQNYNALKRKFQYLVRNSDNFNRSDSSSLGSNWTEICGDMEIWANRFTNVTSGRSAAIYNTQTSGTFQYVRWDVSNYNGSAQNMGCILRFSNSSSGFYEVRWAHGSANWQWNYVSDATYSSVTNIQSISGIAPGDPGSVGVTIKGSGPNTIVSIWLGAISQSPSSDSIWDGLGATYILSASPSTPVNIGNKVGLMIEANYARTQLLDNFNCGDTPEQDSLFTDLIGYWKLDEVSGIRYDSHSRKLDLTPINSPSYITGKIGNAYSGSYASNTALYRSDSATVRLGGNTPFTLAAWVYVTGDDIYNGPIIAKAAFGYGDEFMLAADTGGSSKFTFSIWDAGQAHGAGVYSNSYGSVQYNTWTYVVGWYDDVTQTINIQINNGPVDSLSWTYGTNYLSTFPFCIGSTGPNSTGNNRALTGAVDEAAYWKRVLTNEERAKLYNSGSGLSYPFWPLLAETQFVTASTGSWFEGAADKNIGYKFTVGTAPIIITKLQVTRSTNMSANLDIALYDSDGVTELRRVTIVYSSVSIGSWAETEITPISIPAGAVRHIRAIWAGYNSPRCTNTLFNIVTTSAATINAFSDSTGSPAEAYSPEISFKYTI